MDIRTVGLVAVCTASFVAVADTTIVSVALPSIRRDLGFTDAALPWVLNAYAVSFGGLLLLAGRLGDLHGRRRLFLVGLVVFGLGSLVGGLAPTDTLLVVGRFFQGVGSAAFVPTSLALLTTMFPESHDYHRAVGAYGAMAAAGFVVGMVGGGVITEMAGWRWVLLVNLPVVLGTCLVGVRVLPEARGYARRVDLAGAAAVTGGVASLMFALSSAGQDGWTAPGTVTAGAVGIALLAALAVVERAHPAPLVPGAALARGAVLVPNVAIALQSMIGIAWLYVLTLYLQEVRGHGPLVTGLLFTPMTVASLVAAPVGGRLVSRVGTRSTATGGLVLVGVGLATMAAGMSPQGPLTPVVLGMVVGEAGFMLSNVALTVAGTRELDEEASGLAAGVLNTSIQLGSGVGLAVVATVVALWPSSGDQAAAQAAALRAGMCACGVFCAVALTLLASRAGRAAMASGGARSVPADPE